VPDIDIDIAVSLSVLKIFLAMLLISNTITDLTGWWAEDSS
jgi:hypothetical protein